MTIKCPHCGGLIPPRLVRPYSGVLAKFHPQMIERAQRGDSLEAITDWLMAEGAANALCRSYHVVSGDRSRIKESARFALRPYLPKSSSSRWKRERELAERNVKIVRLRREGKTLREVGRAFNINAERVRCIVAKHERMEARRESQPSFISMLSARVRNAVLSWWSEHGDDGELTLERLNAVPDAELLEIYNFGRLSLAELREALLDAGYTRGAPDGPAQA